MFSASDRSCRRRRRPIPAWPRWAGIAALVLLLGLAPAVAEQAPLQCPHTITLSGNQRINHRDLLKAAAPEIEAFGQNGCRQADVDDAAYQMESAYRAQGFAFARVTYRITPQAAAAAVVFDVTEGPRVFVDGVHLSGNTHMDEPALKALFPLARTGDFSGTVFTRSGLDEAVSRIEEAYIAEGFLDVAVAAPVLEFGPDRSRVSIQVAVAEGTRYIVREVRARLKPGGEAVDCAPDLCAAMIGRPYQRRGKNLLRTALLSTYRNRGYAWADVDVTETPGDHPGDVILTADVTPGARVTIGEVLVKGNARTREAFIRSRLSMAPGDTYSEEKERTSFQDLYRTGLFTTIDMALIPTAAGDPATLVVTVAEAAVTDLYVAPGWGSYELFMLKVGARQRNLFGSGIIFNPEAAVSVKDNRLTLRLTDPWFLNTSLTADLPAYYHYREEPSFTHRDLGFSATLSRAFGNRWKGSAGYSLRKTDITDQSAQQQIDRSATDYDLGSVTLQATRDSRDDIFFPTSGQRLFLAAERADRFLGGSISLNRFSGGWRYFLPVAKATVIGLRYTAGIVLPGQTEVALPISERFFNGGGNSVRSFRESALGPRDTSGAPAGGYGYNTINLELRQRLHGNLIGTLFYDTGNVSPNRTRSERGLAPYTGSAEVISDTLNTFFSGFRSGIGAGLMYMLPIGPLRADVAVNPDADKTRGEDQAVFHFSIGAAF